MRNDRGLAALALLQKQRSHVLFVLSHPEAGHESAFLRWYRSGYRQEASRISSALGMQQYEQHEVDITAGRYPPLPFHYLGIHELSVDGAEEAAGVIEQVAQLHRQQAAAQAPATWLYYPVSEKVGRSPATLPSMLTLAFANGIAGREAEFREWYATRHIRHAMKIDALVSGQCFERTLFQRPGALEPRFNTIAVYEQAGTPQDILASFASLPAGALDFPALDVDASRFVEAVYRPIAE